MLCTIILARVLAIEAHLDPEQFTKIQASALDSSHTHHDHLGREEACLICPFGKSHTTAHSRSPKQLLHASDYKKPCLPRAVCNFSLMFEHPSFPCLACLPHLLPTRSSNSPASDQDFPIPRTSFLSIYTSVACRFRSNCSSFQLHVMRVRLSIRTFSFHENNPEHNMVLEHCTNRAHWLLISQVSSRWKTSLTSCFFHLPDDDRQTLVMLSTMPWSPTLSRSSLEMCYLVPRAYWLNDDTSG